MPLLLESWENAGYMRYRIVNQLDKQTRKKAAACFARYKIQGVIKDCCFDDDEWIISDELMNYRLKFGIEEVLYHDKAEEWSGCSYSCYMECVKAYVSIQMGKYSGYRLRDICNCLRKLSQLSYDEAASEMFTDMTSHVIAFLQILPGENIIRDQLLDSLSDNSWKTNGTTNSRKLADFQYYLRFDKYLREFWSGATEKEAITYFPVWFWWNLTAILPLRVTEFLMTPRDCINEKDGRYFLKIRRTQKKKAKRKVYYRINLDYKICTYEIPEWLYKEIEKYIAATDLWEESSIGTLLRQEISNDSGYFTYVQMTKRLKDFCESVIGERKYPIHLGDTRHLAMISLILSGGSPVICRELAGHENIDISSGYYSNISTVVESAVYEACKGYTEASFLASNVKYPARIPVERFRVEDGWCEVIKVLDGDVSECLKSYSENTGFGDCRNCLHFYSENPVVTASLLKKYKDVVDEDGQYLMQMIELVRKGLGYEEDIQQALLRIQNSAWRYGKLVRDKEWGNQ